MLLIWPTCNFLSNNGSSAICNWQYTGVRTRADIRSRHRDRNGLEVLDNILTISEILEPILFLRRVKNCAFSGKLRLLYEKSG